MARRRVLFLTASYPWAEQPLEGVFVRQHALAASRFADVAVGHGPRCPGERAWALDRQPDVLPTYLLTYRESPVPFTSTAWSLWAAARALSRLRAEGFVPELVHAHFFRAGLPGGLLARAWGVPLVVTEHSSQF